MSLSESAPAQPSRRLSQPLSFLGLSFACVLLVVIGGAMLAGYRAGAAQRESSRRATQTADLQTQYSLGLSDYAAGRYAVAAERFQYILSVDPGYPGAAEQLALAQSALQRTATPRPTAVASGSTPAEILGLAQEYYDAQNWNGVISQLTLLHAVDPDYEVVKADGLLFAALRNRGLERIQGDEMEAGIFDLDQAEAFRPLDQEAINHRAWARLYLAAQSYWGVNWFETIRILQQLYVLAPNFHDTTRRLNEATLKYADQLAAAGDFCGAAAQYAASQQLFIDQGTAAAEATAQAICLLTPTPTPTPDLTASPPASSQGTPAP